MKMFLMTALLATLGCATAFAQDSSPYGPDLAAQIRKIDGKFMGKDGQQVLRVARATYDVAINGGASGSAYGLGVFLPAGALITQSYFYTVTQFVDNGTGTVALSCEDANNIYSAADITGIAAGAKTSGVQTGIAANMTAAIAARCEITATMAGATSSAGKLILFVQYMMVE